MRARRWRHRRTHDVEELNITAFMNLMVILVPFLLITAVFSRLAILQLSLPAPGDDMASADQPELQLEVVIRMDSIEIADALTGTLKLVPNDANTGHYNLAELSLFLQQVKARYPDKTDATLLLEPEIAYDVLVQVMDTVRVFTPSGFDSTIAELFPEISIGDATVNALSSAVLEDR